MVVIIVVIIDVVLIIIILLILTDGDQRGTYWSWVRQARVDPTSLAALDATAPEH